MTTYRIQSINGRFDHVVGQDAAIARAAEMVGAEPGTDAKTLQRDWGVTIEPVGEEVAASVGL